MPLKFDNRISYMDVVAIAAAGLTAMTVFFGVSTDVTTNSQTIAHIQTDLKRIEVTSARRDDEIMVQLKENRQGMKDIRRESAAGRKDIINKLDKLIDRELDHNGTH